MVFSHGGHCFAAANGMVIAVFNTYSCEQLGVLRYASTRAGVNLTCGVVLCEDTRAGTAQA